MLIHRTPRPPMLGKHGAIEADPEGSFRYFGEIIAADPRTRGRVLDVGCGEWPTAICCTALYPMFANVASLDGVDGFPGVVHHPWLTNHWHGLVGDPARVNLPREQYDAAYAVNVVEHLSDPAPFFAAVFAALKPGGAFFAITPHSLHPFAWAVRTIQALGLKDRMVARQPDSNDYPSYYRCNSAGRLKSIAAAAGFSAATFYYHPNTLWRRSLPRPIRWSGWLYDELIATRMMRASPQIMFKLEKPGELPPIVVVRGKSKVRRVSPAPPTKAKAVRVAVPS